MSKKNKSDLIQTFTQQKTLKEPQFQCVIALAGAFQKEIEEPITLRQTIMKNSEMQRCMLHNIIYSIYCTVCRKILCASCMYSSTLHRKHRVVPIESATEELREDLRNFQSKMPRIIQQFDSVAINNNDYLVKVEKDISPVIGKLQQFYEGLRVFIKSKQKQQLAVIKQKRDQIRAEINAYNKELSRVQQYIQQKCKSYANPNIKQQLLIPSRNIIENLLQASKFPKELPMINQKSKFTIDPDKIKGVLEDITYKINQFISFPVFPKDNSKLTLPMTPRSISSKSVKNTPISPITPKVDIPDTERKKRLNSSIAGARTFRKG